jgi:ATP-dependent DNA helicase RecQ
MTRAKQNLCIHHNSNYFDNFKVDGLVAIDDQETYQSPNKISMQLSFTDINLGFFEYRKSQINRLVPGEILMIKDEGCADSSGNIVLKFSKKFNETISHLKDQGYLLKSARINFILFWKDTEKEKESKVILPELDFEK